MKPLRKFKTAYCRYCGMVHKLEGRKYYCPSAFGGWVYLRKKKAPKIVGYRKSLTHCLDETWEWSCPVWFDMGMFAKATIKCVGAFKTQAEAEEDMKNTMKLFGVTKRTKNLNLPPKSVSQPRRAESRKGKR